MLVNRASLLKFQSLLLDLSVSRHVRQRDLEDLGKESNRKQWYCWADQYSWAQKDRGFKKLFQVSSWHFTCFLIRCHHANSSRPYALWAKGRDRSIYRSVMDIVYCFSTLWVYSQLISTLNQLWFWDSNSFRLKCVGFVKPRKNLTPITKGRSVMLGFTDCSLFNLMSKFVDSQQLALWISCGNPFSSSDFIVCRLWTIS